MTKCFRSDLFFIIVLLFLGNGFALSQSHITGEYDPAKRERWIDETAHILKNFTQNDTTRISALKTREKDGKILQSYRILGQGLINFDNGDWVYILLHSSHDNDSIGDISLAVDQKGRIFKHEGHVCGGICHYEALAPEEFTSSKDFFKYFRDDTDGLPWERYRK